MSLALDVLSAILLVSLCGLVRGLSRVDPLVFTKGGLIRGFQSDDGFATFLGVPYAVVDKNHPFGPSVPHPGFEDTFEAYESTMCPQLSGNDVVGNIDCLTLNVHVPSSANSGNRLPVMVWVHGGAFVTGSATPDNSPNFLLRNDVIVVAINYRLGIYGFMCLDIPEVSGNQGLKDQVLALRWINENIEAFGGDAQKLTVFGESAGGMAVNLHLFSSYESLFQQAIIQSGPAVSPWAIKDVDNTIPLKIAEALDYITEDVADAVAYLSTVDADTLLRIALELKITEFTYQNYPLIFPCIEKNIEGVKHFITEHPMNITSAKVAATPIIIGTNDNEMPFLYRNVDAEYFANYNFDKVSLSFDLGDNLKDALDDIGHFYIGDEETSINVQDQLTDFASDCIFNHPTQRMAKRLLEIGAKTVYRYIFSYSGDRNFLKISLNLNSTGAIHADELGYLFDKVSLRGDITPEDQLMIDRITTLWTNFAKYGDPTPETSVLLPFKWEPVTKTTQPYLSMDSDLTLEGRPFKERMAFWDLFFKLHRNQQKYYQDSDE